MELSFLAFSLLLASASDALFIPFNATHLLLSPAIVSPPVSPLLSTPPFLEDVVRAIAERERWDPRGDVRVSALDAGGARVGSSQRYEFRVLVAKTVLLVKFYDEAVSWRKLGSGETGFGPDLVVPRPAVRPLVLQGPLDLLVGSGNDELSLSLPALNVTHKGLRRIVVGNGITIKIEGAHEVSLFHPHNINPLLNGSIALHSKDRRQFWSIVHDLCAPILSVHVMGSASLVAYKTHNFGAHIGTVFRSHNAVELLPDKCYSQWHFKQTQSCSLCSVSSRFVFVEKVLRSLLGYRIFQNRSMYFIKEKILSTTLVKFQLQLERDVMENDRIWKKAAEWRTKPTVERVWFEVVARAGDGRRLKPVLVKKLKRPYTVVDSTAWSNLMSNMSFTQFASVIAPPEALTLDVKW